MELLKEVENAVDSDHKKDGCSLGEVLQGSHNISYKAKDDTAGVSLGMSANCCDYGKQLSVEELGGTKRIVHFQNKNCPTSP